MMKKTLLTITAIAIALTACKDDKEASADESSMNVEVVPVIETEPIVVTRSDAEKMANEMRENVEVDDNNDISIKNFPAYGQLQNQIKNLSTKPETRTTMNSKKAIEAFEYFVDNMPNYLKTNLVMKEVADVRQAMTRFQADMDDTTTSEKTIKRHLKNMDEAVADLNDEIVDLRLSLDRDKNADFSAYYEFVSNVNYDDAGVITIVNFEEYDKVQNDWDAMNAASGADKMQLEKSLSASFNNMVNRLPAYLKIDDVNDAIADVQKEMKEYETEVKNPKIETEEHLENLEEVDEALYDLNKELLKSRKKYNSNKSDAIEEFMEEYNSNSDQSMSERLNDATEEYNEEMNN